jgi:hypothetical protein
MILENQVDSLVVKKEVLETSNVSLEKHIYRLLVQNEVLRAKAGIPANSVLSRLAFIAKSRLRDESIFGGQDLGA